MAEIGAGAGTGYPAAIDSDVTLETVNDYARIAIPNDLAAAVVAIQTELGLLPKGGFASVRARLDTLSMSAGVGVPRGLAAARPAASAGTWYKSMDTGVLEYSDGTDWFPVLTGG